MYGSTIEGSFSPTIEWLMKCGCFLCKDVFAQVLGVRYSNACARCPSLLTKILLRIVLFIAFKRQLADLLSFSSVDKAKYTIMKKKKRTVTELLLEQIRLKERKGFSCSFCFLFSYLSLAVCQFRYLCTTVEYGV